MISKSYFYLFFTLIITGSCKSKNEHISFQKTKVKLLKQEQVALEKGNFNESHFLNAASNLESADSTVFIKNEDYQASISYFNNSNKDSMSQNVSRKIPSNLLGFKSFGNNIFVKFINQDTTCLSVYYFGNNYAILLNAYTQKNEVSKMLFNENFLNQRLSN